VHHHHRHVLVVQGTKHETPYSAYLLQPTSANKNTLKYVIDGIHDLVFMRQLEGGNENLDAHYAMKHRHMCFAQYLASRCISVDIFDADSRLQIGTASISLKGLLRQGREHAECVLKVPVLDPLESMAQKQSGVAQRSCIHHTTGPDGSPVSKGILQVPCRGICSRAASC
jgi:nephrocystin-4